MTRLYPTCEPYATHRINVDDYHQIYLEECGNPKGIPVVFLHGGPGSGCSPDHRRLFNPDVYRIVLFDQRGAGRSQPLGETRKNTTSALVADMEAIRQTLGIEKWLLFGGSWGATLALVYALTHPERASGLILRGSFLARESDVEWFLIGLQRLFPQAWGKFTADIGNSNNAREVINWYTEAVQGEDQALSLRAARNWSNWGNLVVTWQTSETFQAQNAPPLTQGEQNRVLAKARIETHYASHRYFIEENEILQRIGMLPAVPVAIIHGKFDLTCTMEAAWQLHQAIPDSRMIQVEQAGHLTSDPAMTSALMTELERMRTLL